MRGEVFGAIHERKERATHGPARLWKQYCSLLCDTEDIGQWMNDKSALHLSWTHTIASGVKSWHGTEKPSKQKRNLWTVHTSTAVPFTYIGMHACNALPQRPSVRVVCLVGYAREEKQQSHCMRRAMRRMYVCNALPLLTLARV